MTTLHYTGNRGLDSMSTLGVSEQVQKEVVQVRRGRQVRNNPIANGAESTKKEDKKMSEPKKVQKTVFDLQKFDNVLLVKMVELPEKPGSVEDALKMIGNDTKEIVDVIYEGIIARTVETARKDMTGFKVLDEEGEPGEDYTGQFADEKKGDLINAAILSIAKMQGYNKELPKERKRELKEKAAEFLRQNPAMLASIQG
jgi:hypothetical protein